MQDSFGKTGHPKDYGINPACRTRQDKPNTQGYLLFRFLLECKDTLFPSLTEACYFIFSFLNVLLCQLHFLFQAGAVGSGFLF
jgi:hypothetical protein